MLTCRVCASSSFQAWLFGEGKWWQVWGGVDSVESVAHWEPVLALGKQMNSCLSLNACKKLCWGTSVPSLRKLGSRRTSWNFLGCWILVVIKNMGGRGLSLPSKILYTKKLQSGGCFYSLNSEVRFPLKLLGMLNLGGYRKKWREEERQGCVWGVGDAESSIKDIIYQETVVWWLFLQPK